MLGRAGWILVACLAMGEEGIPDDHFAEKPADTEREIDQRKNRARDAMNNALIAIEARNPALTRLRSPQGRRAETQSIRHAGLGA